MADALTETARQVRLPGGVPHQLVADSFDPERGRIYITACGERLTGQQAAMLTTHPVECGNCHNPRRRARTLALLAQAGALQTVTR